jgi:hypothetical protein
MKKYKVQLTITVSGEVEISHVKNAIANARTLEDTANDEALLRAVLREATYYSFDGSGEEYVFGPGFDITRSTTIDDEFDFSPVKSKNQIRVEAQNEKRFQRYLDSQGNMAR